MPKNINGWPAVNGRPVAGVGVGLASELHQARRKARELGLEFLNTELEMAEAFLDLAETTGNAAASERNILNAVKALDAIGRFLEHLSPDQPERRFLVQRTAELRARLVACGARRQPQG